VKSGEFYQIEITDSMEYDLIGRVLQGEAAKLPA
jgi:hypothetical protein